MVNSLKAANRVKQSIPRFDQQAIADVLFNSLKLAHNIKIIVAYSGGKDSQALLHLLIALREEYPIELIVAHFDHGINSHSAQWALQCQQRCEHLSITFVTQRQVIAKQTGQNLEAVARQARYRWLASVAESIDGNAVVMTAHHADDQAETFLYRMFRGGAIRDLGGIYQQRPLCSGSKVPLIRPLLQFERCHIDDYIEQQGIPFVEDPSNADLRYDRNYLRHQLLSRLKQRNPIIVQQLCRAAEQCRQITLQENNLYAQYIEQFSLPERKTPFCLAAPLCLSKLLELDDYSLQGFILFYFYINNLESFSNKYYKSLLAQLRSGAEHQSLQRSDGYIRIFNNSLYLVKIPSATPEAIEGSVGEAVISKSGEVEHYTPLADLGIQYRWSRAQQQGFDLDLLNQHEVQWYWRKGGERITLMKRNHSSSLKKVLNEYKIAPWVRDYLPMLMVDSQIVWIHGVGVTDAASIYVVKKEGMLPEFNALLIES